jgi:hypothetical protein
MKRIFYASGSVVTGDRMANAVVHYAEILAQRDASDTIDIPITLSSGEPGRAQVLLGPGSQLVVVPEEGTDEHPEDDATIAELERRARSHGSPRALASDEGDHAAYINDYNSDFSSSDFSSSSLGEGD